MIITTLIPFKVDDLYDTISNYYYQILVWQNWGLGSQSRIKFFLS